MNRTQKSAWYVLVTFLLAIAILTYVLVKIFVLRSWPESIFARFWPVMVYCAFTVASIIFLRKKQSPVEVPSDERDNLIKKRAVCAGFVSVWILLAVATIIPQLIAGPTSSIPVWILSFINLSVFLITMLVYSTAILVQYGWGQKDGGE